MRVVGGGGVEKGFGLGGYSPACFADFKESSLADFFPYFIVYKNNTL
jgi:hypothetical protein